MALTMIPGKRGYVPKLLPEIEGVAGLFLLPSFGNVDLVRGFTLTRSGTSIAVIGNEVTELISTTNGSANYATAGTSTWFDPPSTGYTMLFYGNRYADSSALYDRIFHRDIANVQGNNSFGFLLTPLSDPNPGRVYFASKAGGAANVSIGYTTANKAAPAGLAYYVLSHDGTTARLYQDGILQDSGACGVPGASSLELRIGSGSGLACGAPFGIAAAGLLRAALPAEMTKSPLQLLEQRRIWVPVSAGGGAPNGTLIDSTASADILSATIEVTRTATESTATADLQSAVAELIASLSEAAAASDTQSSGATASATLTDSATVADIQSALSDLVAQITEGTSTTDLLTASRIANAAATEAAATTDTATTGTQLTGSLTEAAVSVEALTAAATLLAQIVEAGSAQDQLAAVPHLVTLLTESAAGSDVAAVPVTYSVTVAELAAALDLIAAGVAGSVQLSAAPLGQRLSQAVRIARLGVARSPNLSTRTRS